MILGSRGFEVKGAKIYLKNSIHECGAKIGHIWYEIIHWVNNYESFCGWKLLARDTFLFRRHSTVEHFTTEKVAYMKQLLKFCRTMPFTLEKTVSRFTVFLIKKCVTLFGVRFVSQNRLLTASSFFSELLLWIITQCIFKKLSTYSLNIKFFPESIDIKKTRFRLEMGFPWYADLQLIKILRTMLHETSKVKMVVSALKLRSGLDWKSIKVYTFGEIAIFWH